MGSLGVFVCKHRDAVEVALPEISRDYHSSEVRVRS